MKRFVALAPAIHFSDRMLRRYSWQELREKEQALIRAADREQEKLYDGLGGHSRTVTSIVIGSKYVFTGSADWSIRKWDPTTYKCRGIFRGHVGTVWALDIGEAQLMSSTQTSYLP